MSVSSWARAGCVLGACAMTVGCVYYNSIYNAERAFAEAEAHRRVGRDSAAVSLYREAERKAIAGYRKEPTGEWADQALFIVGRANLHLDRPAIAREALQVAAELTDEETIRLEASIYLAEALHRSGLPHAALDLLDSSLVHLHTGAVFAEGHLLRGRLRLMLGRLEGAKDDFRTAAVSPELAARVASARIALAVERNRPDWARDALEELFADPTGWRQSRTVLPLVREGVGVWGVETGARLLSGAEETDWPSGLRDEFALTRAKLMVEAGDSAAGRAAVRRIAVGSGPLAGSARLWLAGEELARVGEVPELDSIRQLLLPIASDSRAAHLIAAMDEVSLLAGPRPIDPVSLFVAAELARDELAAPKLALGLFLSFASADANGPWVGKGLLAAIGLTRVAALRLDLLGRIDAIPDDPYVRAARDGHMSAEVESLETRLAHRISRVRAR